jgi:hypothetical protein
LTSTSTVRWKSEGGGTGGPEKPIPESDGGSAKTGTVAVVDWLSAGPCARGARRSSAGAPPPPPAFVPEGLSSSTDDEFGRSTMVRGPLFRFKVRRSMRSRVANASTGFVAAPQSSPAFAASPSRIGPP